MAAITQLSPMGMPGRRYGSFAGRVAASAPILAIHLYPTLRLRLDLDADLRRRSDLTLDLRESLNMTDVHLGGDDN